MDKPQYPAFRSELPPLAGIVGGDFSLTLAYLSGWKEECWEEGLINGPLVWND